MTKRVILTIISRIAFLLVGAGIVVAAYILIRIALAPVPVPFAPAVPRSVAFDPKLDVTKNVTFGRLRPVGPVAIEIGQLGRDNPFIPPPTSTRELRVEIFSAPPTSTATTTRIKEIQGEAATGTPPQLFSTSTR